MGCILQKIMCSLGSCQSGRKGFKSSVLSFDQYNPFSNIDTSINAEKWKPPPRPPPKKKKKKDSNQGIKTLLSVNSTLGLKTQQNIEKFNLQKAAFWSQDLFRVYERLELPTLVSEREVYWPIICTPRRRPNQNK